MKANGTERKAAEPDARRGGTAQKGKDGAGGFLLARTVRGYALQAEVRPLNDGIQVLVTGGSRTHVGAVSLAEPQAGGAPVVQTLQREQHRDAAVSAEWAQALCAALGAPVCVCAGIHYDRADAALIAEILDVSRALCAEAVQKLADGAAAE